MNKYGNQQKDEFIATRPLNYIDIESEIDSLSGKCKFNFAYLDSQKSGQTIRDWTEKQVKDLFEKLHHYSKKSLIALSKNEDFINYKNFPPKSKTNFEHPKHIPIDVEWARFRLTAKARLVGFIVPASLHGKQHGKTDWIFDKNTFYVVFLDGEHLFYKTKK